MLRRRALLASVAVALLSGCGSGQPVDGAEDATGAGSASGASTTGAGSSSTGGSTTSGGPSALDELLARLRADRDGTLLLVSDDQGWPAPVEGGRLYVSADPSHDAVAGDHDGWAGTPMTADDGFAWLVLDTPAGSRYKLVGGGDFVPDPWARAYAYDEFGEMTLIAPPSAHLERFFEKAGHGLGPRTVRIWVPADPPTHVLYAHDGQNLFDPSAAWGGWRVDESAPPAMLVVGIDNTPARMDEYTHVPDVISGQTMGGMGDAYADLVEDVVKPLVAAHYGEPARVGVMGSSLGGLIALHMADRRPDAFAFAASLSGTVGWGSIGANEETIIERYAAHGHRPTVLYVDSGGGGDCFDGDGDGIEDDDPNGADNYCENRQLEGTLGAVGYAEGTDLFSVWEPGATHDEAAWAARVGGVMALFAGL